MNAEKARAISEENKVSIEKIQQQIEKVATQGMNQLIATNASDETIKELMKLGYKSTIHKDPINGYESYIISW